MNQPMEIVTGLAITLGLGLGVRRYIDWAIPELILKRPDSIKDEDWNSFVQRHGAGGSAIGFLERLLSYASFTIPEYTILAGWFAFKLAAKWETWKNIVQVPTSMEGFTPLHWYHIRKAFGSWLLSRFLLGTLVNVLIGAVGAYSGKIYCAYVGWLCSSCAPIAV